MTSRQVFIRVYRPEIFSHGGIFNSALWTIALFSGSHLPPSSFPCVNKYIIYTCTVCKGEGYGVLGLRQIKHQFFWWRHFALPSMSLIFVREKHFTGNCRKIHLQAAFKRNTREHFVFFIVCSFLRESNPVNKHMINFQCNTERNKTSLSFLVYSKLLSRFSIRHIGNISSPSKWLCNKKLMWLMSHC